MGRPVGDAIVAHLFPDPAASRIPVIGIAGSHAQRRATVAQLLAIFMHLDGIRAGLACSTGAYVGGRRITAGDCAHWQAATHLLMNRSVDVAIIENGMASMAGEGLAYDRCRIGVVTGLDPDDILPARDLRNPEAMFKVLRTQIDVVLPEGTGVLAAEDPAVASMAALCDGEVIFYGADPAGEVLAEHVAMGRRAVSIRNGTVVLQHGSLEIPVLHTTAPPIAAAWNRLDANSILAAIAAGWAMELGVELMASGIETWIDGAAMDGRSAHFGALPWN
jgi:cyanophycin synthetase